MMPVTTETTTVTTTSNSSGLTGTSQSGPVQTSGCDGPMHTDDFLAAKKKVAGNTFEDGKLSRGQLNVMLVHPFLYLPHLFF